jgi:hypothetical protein
MQPSNMYPITDFNAAPGCTTLNTTAIQQAIDAAHAANGGTVLIPAGTWLTGTLYLKSNVTLYLEAQAVLLGSADLDDYTIPVPEGSSPIYAQCLLYCQDAEKVTISGPGTIDGQGAAFPHGTEGINVEDYDTLSASPRAFVRPILMKFIHCTDITVTGVTLQNPAHFIAVLDDVDRFHAHGVRGEARANQNGDGFQMHNCRNVFISDCQLDCSDDCLPFVHNAENVVVTNCVLSSRWAALRFGPGSQGRMHNIAVSNCVIHDTFGCGIKMQQVDGGTFEDIRFNNLLMDNVTGPISLRLALWRGWGVLRDTLPPYGTFRNVSFSNIRARVPENSQPRDYEVPRTPGELRQCLNITGLPGHPIEGITFENVHITYFGGGTAQEAARADIPEMEDYYPEYHMFGTLPAYGFYIRHARDIVLRNVTLDFEHDDLRPAIICDDVADLELDSVRARGNPGADALIRLQDTRGAFIHSCRPTNDVSNFIEVLGESSTGIFLVANDVRRAACQVTFAGGADPVCLEQGTA